MPPPPQDLSFLVFPLLVPLLPPKFTSCRSTNVYKDTEYPSSEDGIASGSRLSSRQQSTIDAIVTAAKQGQFSVACRLHFCLSLDLKADNTAELPVAPETSADTDTHGQRARGDSVRVCASTLPSEVGHKPSAFYDEAVTILYERREADQRSE